MAVCECNAAAAAPVAGIPDSRYCLGGLLLVCLKKWMSRFKLIIWLRLRYDSVFRFLYLVDDDRGWGLSIEEWQWYGVGSAVMFVYETNAKHDDDDDDYNIRI